MFTLAAKARRTRPHRGRAPSRRGPDAIAARSARRRRRNASSRLRRRRERGSARPISPRPRRSPARALAGGCFRRGSRPTARPAPSLFPRSDDDGALHRRRARRPRSHHRARARSRRPLPGLPLRRLARARARCSIIARRGRGSSTPRRSISTRSLRSASRRPRGARTSRGSIRAISRSSAPWASSCGA